MTGRACKGCGGTGWINMGPTERGGAGVKDVCYYPECNAPKLEIDNRKPWEIAGYRTKDEEINAAEDRWNERMKESENG